MKKLLAVLILALALPLAAQTPAPEPTPEQLKQLATIMRQQRDALSQQLLDTQSQLQLVAAENESLKKQLNEAQAKRPTTTGSIGDHGGIGVSGSILEPQPVKK